MTKELLQQALDALTTAVKQNQHDMLMTGAECRAGEAAIAAIQTTIAQQAQQAENSAGLKALNCALEGFAQPVQPAVTNADFKESVGLMLAAVGYTEEYANQWPKEKVSITFKRWFDEQLEKAKAAQAMQQALRNVTDDEHHVLTKALLRSSTVVAGGRLIPQPDEIHSCSFFCDLPACIKRQRDELRDKYVKAIP